MPDPAAQSTLRATYTTPSTTSKVFTRAISSPLPSSEAARSVEEKRSYLAEVRAQTRQLQEEVNVFLTGKMEEDKANADRAVGGRSEEELEEGYGGEEEEEEEEGGEDWEG